MARSVILTINHKDYEMAIEPNETLLEVLRDRLGLTGTKTGCNTGDCGACTVLMEGKPVNSCLVLAVRADGCHISTVEGLAEGEDLHHLQAAFLDKGSVQCGFCTPGMLMTAKGLLDGNPHPSTAEIREALSGNLCRCTGYMKIIEAVASAAGNGKADPFAAKIDDAVDPRRKGWRKSQNKVERCTRERPETMDRDCKA